MIFDRQIAFWGEEKQQCLEKASVFVAGIGGLGCLLSEILVRSGVGKIYLCDKGRVDEPDLNRQMFYTMEHIGKKKIQVAAAWLSGIHTYTEVVPLDKDIMSDDFCLPDDIDGVADCLDNFESRFSLWNSLSEGLFFVHSGVEEFFGQVLSLIKGRSADFLKIFANYDKRERIIPVSANVVSVVSSVASTEVLNHLFHEPKLVDKFLIIDMSDFTFQVIRLKAED